MPKKETLAVAGDCPLWRTKFYVRLWPVSDFPDVRFLALYPAGAAPHREA